MKWCKILLQAGLIICLFSGISQAHFGMVIPSDTMVMQEDNRTIDVQLSFSHPFEMVGMPLEMPAAFFVVHSDVKTDLAAVNGFCCPLA